MTRVKTNPHTSKPHILTHTRTHMRALTHTNTHACTHRESGPENDGSYSVIRPMVVLLGESIT